MRVQRKATHAMWLVQAIRSANVRADAIVFNSALSAYARRLRTATAVEAPPMPLDMQRLGFPPTTVSYYECQRASSCALHAARARCVRA